MVHRGSYHIGMISLGVWALVWGSLLGCGALGGSRQVISIDSTERGQTIYYRDGAYIGKTPMFSEVLPEPRITLITKKGSIFSRHRFPCRFRWWESPLENSPLIVFGASIGAASGMGLITGSLTSIFLGTAVDTIDGAAFECPAQFLIGMGPPSQPYPLKCAVQTPAELDDDAREALLSQWFKKPEVSSLCSSVLDATIMRTHARMLQLPKNLEEVSKRERSKIYRFGYETGAGRLVVLERLEKGPSADSDVTKTAESTVSDSSGKEVAVEPQRSNADQVAGLEQVSNVQAQHVNEEPVANKRAQHPRSAVNTNTEKKNEVSSREAMQQWRDGAKESSREDAVEPKAVLSTKVTIGPTSVAPSRNSQHSTETIPTNKLSPKFGQNQQHTHDSKGGLIPFPVRQKVIDLHRLEVESDARMILRISPQLETELTEKSVSGWLRSRVRLIPDAISFVRGQVRFWGDVDDASTDVLSIAVGHISHPSAFSRYDLDLSLSPEIIADLLPNELTLYPNGPAADEGAILKFRRFGVGVSVNAEGHTPIGAFGAGLAVGGMYVNASQPEDHAGGAYIGFRGRYTGFLSKSIYYRLELSVDETTEIALGDWRFSRLAKVYFLQLGWHVPGFEAWLRSKF